MVNLLNNKIKSYRKFYLYVVAGGIVDVVWLLVVRDNDATLLIGILVMAIISVNIEYEPPVLRKYFLVIIMYFLIGIIDSAFASVVMIFGSFSVDTIMDNHFNNFVVNLASVFFYAFLILVKDVVSTCNRKKNELNRINLKSLFVILIIIINLGIYISPLELSAFSNGEIKGQKLLVIAAGVISIYFVIMAFGYYIQRAEKTELEREMILNCKINKSKENYYKMLMHKNIQTIDFRHDIKNHIYCMQVLMKEHKYNELSQYLDDMSGKLQTMSKSVDIGNELVNAIILDELGDEKNITLSVNGKLPNNIKLKNIDLCTIFSNLFKNAVEAQLQVKGEKWIRLDIKVVNNFLTLTLQNSTDKNIEIVDNKLITSKSNKELHGIGSINIRNCIKQYGGSVEYNCENYIFTCQIIIPDVLINNEPFTA